MARIGGIQKALEFDQTSNLIHLECALKINLKRARLFTRVKLRKSPKRRRFAVICFLLISKRIVLIQPRASSHNCHHTSHHPAIKLTRKQLCTITCLRTPAYIPHPKILFARNYELICVWDLFSE